MTTLYDIRELPRLKRWLEQGESVWSFLAAQGGAELAVAFAALYWPEFVEVKGCVLLRERYDPRNFKGWWEQLGGDPTRIESVINHVHLWDLFEPDEENVPEEAIESLARVLCSSWKCALCHRFPDRDFDVRLILDDADSGPTISFVRVR